MRYPSKTTWMALVCGALLAGCSDYRDPGDPGAANYWSGVEAQSAQAVEGFKSADPELGRFFSTARGYAVFPDVVKGAIGIGGARGQGVLYQREGEGVRVVGYCEMKQGTLGAQLGGQSYREIIFFQHDAALEEFKRGETQFSGQASAVAASKGASTDVDYKDGVAVFTEPLGGLMFEASIGGQKFTYTAKEHVEP